MGKRGPAPKPTHLRAIEGNPSRRPLPSNEPVPTGAPVCPDYLGALARQAWERVLASTPPGMVTAADTGVLIAYCEACELMETASRELAEYRDLAGSALLRDGKPHPLIRVRRDAAQTMAAMGAKLGLSPSDRSGLKLPEAQTKEGSKWAGLTA
jgi:P27 family predicted phage terminase small subunit